MSKDNAKYFHGGEDYDFSKLKDTGLAGEIRTAAILLEGEHYEENPGPGETTLHQWADEAAALQVALGNARNDQRSLSKRVLHDYEASARTQLSRKKAYKKE